MTTPRLTLRPFRPSDADALYAYLSDPEVVRFEPYEPFTREACTQEAADRAASDAFCAVCLQSGEVIGNLYVGQKDDRSFEIGWVFNRAYWHHGYATEAAARMLAYLFDEKHAHRVCAMCDPRNPPSWRLMERLGMRREALLHKNVAFRKDAQGLPLWQDTYIYALLDEEWIKRDKR